MSLQQPMYLPQCKVTADIDGLQHLTGTLMSALQHSMISLTA